MRLKLNKESWGNIRVLINEKDKLIELGMLKEEDQNEYLSEQEVVIDLNGSKILPC